MGYSTASVSASVITRSLDAFADLLVDVLGKPSLAVEELGRLKRETLAELIEARDHDRELGNRWFRETLFAGHPYARPSAGTPKSVEAIGETRRLRAVSFDALRREPGLRVRRRHRRRPRAQGRGPSVTAALPKGSVHRDTVAEPALARGRKLVIVDKPERTQTQILIGCLGTHPRDPDHVALHVGNTIFGGTFTARLMKEVRSKRGWSYGAYSNLPYDRHRRGFSLWTFPKASDAAPCIELELGLLQKWWEDGVTPRELAWAKRYLVRSHAFAIDTAPKRIAQTLEELVYDLPERYHADYLEHVQALTVEQINAAIRERITPDDLVVTVVGTAAAIGDDVKKAIPDLASTEIVPFDS